MSKKRKSKKSKKHTAKKTRLIGRCKMSGRRRGRTKKKKIQARKKTGLMNKKPIAKKTTKKKGGGFMAKHRRKMHGFARKQVIVMRGKQRRHGRRRGYLMGDPGLVGRMGNNALNVAAGVAGGIGGAFISNMIPVPANTKAFFPILGGILLATMSNVPALKFAGIGLGVVGGLSLVKNLMPGVPLLAGETTIMLPAPSDPKQLGDPVHIGNPISIEESAGLGWSTQADT